MGNGDAERGAGLSEGLQRAVDGSSGVCAQRGASSDEIVELAGRGKVECGGSEEMIERGADSMLCHHERRRVIHAPGECAGQDGGAGSASERHGAGRAGNNGLMKFSAGAWDEGDLFQWRREGEDQAGRLDASGPTDVHNNGLLVLGDRPDVGCDPEQRKPRSNHGRYFSQP